MDNIENNAELKNKILKLLNYIEKIMQNGEAEIISALFQVDFQIIKLLIDKKDVNPSIIASRLNITRPNVAANLKKLEQKGYISRTTNSENRRQIYVNLTEKGIKYYSICQLQLNYLFASWFDLIGEEETEHLFKILELSSNPDLVTEKIRHFTFGKN